MPKVRARAVACFGLLACACAFALDPALDISQYAHTPWKILKGFNKGAIYSIAQTSDGYLWLGTPFGLLRFDGVRTVPWYPPRGQRLPVGTIRSLLASRDGTLWIGASGLASWKNGRLTQYPDLAGRLISTLVEDREGTLWVGTIGAPPTGRLCAIRGGRAQCYGDDGGLGPGVLALYEDHKGSLWAGVKDGLWRWKPGPPKFYSLPGESDGIQALAEDADGALLVGWNGAIYRFVDGKTEAYSMRGASSKFRAIRLLRDRDGGLWIGTQESGLWHVHQGRTDAPLPTEDMSGEDVYALFEDHEGDILAGTRNGFDRFRDFAVATLTVDQGLSKNHVGSAIADKNGSLWLATYGGLNRWEHGKITVPRIDSTKPDGKLNGYAPNSLFRDDRGRIWLSTPRELGHLENGRFTSIRGVPSGYVLCFAQDTAGNIWVLNENFLVRISPQNEIQTIPWAALGHKDHASVLAADRKRGGLWIGFFLGGIVYFADGGVRASYTAADGLGEDRVSGFQFDDDGALWISTEGGLSRLKNNRVVTLDSKSGLPCDAVHWVIEDNDRSLWMYMNCGLVQIARPELDAWAAAVDKAQDTSLPIKVTVFNSSDGVRSLSEPSHYNPQVAKTPDGKLWFLPLDGVSVIDPHHIPFNNVPPPVHIERILADRKPYETSNGVRMPAHVRDLEIDYTALSLVAPEKVRFRYKLEGQDPDWREVINQRNAQYSNLPPGHYRFRVIASNNSGVWNEEGTSLDFAIAPAYYQTNWFRALCGLTFLAMFWTVYKLRVRALERRQALLERNQVLLEQNQELLERHQTEIRALNEQLIKAQEAERMRIAGELHDSVLQQITSFTLRLGKVKRQVAPDSEAKATVSSLQQELIQIGTDIRHISHELHPALLQDAGLPAALSAYCEEFSRVRGMPVSCETDKSVEELSPGVALCLFRIAQEALGNASKYSAAKKVEVRLTRADGRVRLSVSDDGVGCDPNQTGKSGGLGVINMRERVLQLKGTFEFDSAPGRGTTVKAEVPFRLAP
jgi:signal transduction histidine kinase/ligand-binding sensor domain-containing protein